jgi:hypothetical protein
LRPTRRNFILGFVTLVGFDPPGLLQTPDGRARHTGPIAQLPSDAATDNGSLTRTEIEDLLAFAEPLVTGGPLSPDERAYLEAHLGERVKQGGGYYLTLYRSTASFLGLLAGTRFSSLELPDRTALVTRHRFNVSEVGARESLGPFPEETRLVRTRAGPDLIGGYYASPAGWRIAGYDVFPGQCGDLLRYTRAER